MIDRKRIFNESNRPTEDKNYADNSFELAKAIHELGVQVEDLAIKLSEQSEGQSKSRDIVPEVFKALGNIT